MKDQEQTPLHIDYATGEVLNHKGARLNDQGQELPDPRPMAPPVGYVKQPPLHELIRQMVRSEALQAAAEAAGADTFEEADDFDVDDDFDPDSPYENEFDPFPGVPGVPPGAEPAAEPPPAEPPSSPSQTPGET